MNQRIVNFFKKHKYLLIIIAFALVLACILLYIRGDSASVSRNSTSVIGDIGKLMVLKKNDIVEEVSISSGKEFLIEGEVIKGDIDGLILLATGKVHGVITRGKEEEIEIKEGLVYLSTGTYPINISLCGSQPDLYSANLSLIIDTKTCTIVVVGGSYILPWFQSNVVISPGDYVSYPNHDRAIFDKSQFTIDQEYAELRRAVISFYDEPYIENISAPQFSSISTQDGAIYSESPLTVTGSTDAGNRLYLILGGVMVNGSGVNEILIDSNGEFSTSIDLIRGEDTIEFRLVDPYQNVSTIRYTITYK